MSKLELLYFRLMSVLLRTPLIRRFSLCVHVAMSTYRVRGSRFVSEFFRVRRHLHRRETRAVFLVYEPRFRRIVDELEGRGIEVLIFGRGLFDYWFQHHLTQYLAVNARAFGEYSLSAYARYPSERAHYLADCLLVARLAKASFAIDTIVLPKYNDDYTLEMVHAFSEAGWKTIVYDREGTVTKKRLELVPVILSTQAVPCDFVVTYNETHKAFFERLFDLSSIPPAKIVVMGNPASDDWFHDQNLLKPSPSRKNGRKILFFAFGEFSYVYADDYLKGKDEVWRRMLAEIHDGLMAHCRERTDDEVLYKRGAKGNRDYWLGSEHLLELNNVRLIPVTANSNVLIAESDFVVAFQTTALIEAMHTSKVLIYCAWGDRYEELKEGLIDFEGYAREGALLHARSPEELRQFLSRNPGDVPIDMTARKRIRETFTSNPDGRVAQRFTDWIICDLAVSAPSAASRGGSQ